MRRPGPIPTTRRTTPARAGRACSAIATSSTTDRPGSTRRSPRNDDRTRERATEDTMSDDRRATYDGQADDDRTDVLHEQDDQTTVGGGVMGSGGTAVDRGTGQLDETDTDTTDADDATGATGVVAG